MNFNKILLCFAAILISANSFSQTAADYNNTGNELADAGNFIEALKSYNAAILVDSTVGESYYLRGKCYYMLEQDLLAIKDYSKAIKLDPTNKNAYYRRAQSKEYTGDIEGASGDYFTATRLDSNFVDAYVGRAFLFLKQNQIMPAFTYFSIAIKKQPNAPANVFFGRGYCHQLIGSYSQAIDDYKKAIELVPDYADAHLNLGNTYLTIKEYDNAITYYDKTIELNPNDNRAFIGRAYAFFYKNDIEKACRDRKKAIELGYVDTTNLFGKNCN